MDVLGNVISIDRDLPASFARRRLTPLANRVGRYRSDGVIGLSTDAARDLVEAVADPDSPSDLFERLEEKETSVGTLLVARGCRLYTLSLLPFLDNPRVLDKLPSGADAAYDASVIARVPVRGTEDAHGPVAHLVVEFPSLESFLATAAKVTHATLRDNTQVQDVAVAKGGVTLDPVSVVLVEVVIGEHKLPVEIGGHTELVTVPAMTQRHLVTWDGNTRAGWRRSHLLGEAKTEAQMLDRIRGWLTQRRQVKVRRSDGSELVANIDTFASARDLASSAEGRLAAVRNDPLVRQLERERYDPAEPLKSRVASMVTSADVVLAFRPARDLGQPSAELFRVGFDEHLRGTHAQKPWEPEADTASALDSALRRLPHELVDPVDAALMRGDIRVVGDDDVSRPFMDAALKRFDVSSRGLALLKATALVPQLLTRTSPTLRQAITAAVGWKRQTRRRKAALVARGVQTHLDGAVRRWSTQGAPDFRSVGYNALKYEALPVDRLGSDWTVSARPIDELESEALAELEAVPQPPLDQRPAAVELAATAVAALTYGGVLRSPGGGRVARPEEFRRNANTWNIGTADGTTVPIDKPPGDVLEALASRAPGIRQLAQTAREFIYVLDTPGETPQLHAVNPQSGAVLDDKLYPGRLICIAFPDEVAARAEELRRAEDDEDEDDDREGEGREATPTQLLREAVENVVGLVSELNTRVDGIIEVLDGHKARIETAAASDLFDLVRTYQDANLRIAGQMAMIQAAGARVEETGVDEDEDVLEPETDEQDGPPPDGYFSDEADDAS